MPWAASGLHFIHRLGLLLLNTPRTFLAIAMVLQIPKNNSLSGQKNSVICVTTKLLAAGITTLELKNKSRLHKKEI